jgi:hypothetical protein
VIQQGNAELKGVIAGGNAALVTAIKGLNVSKSLDFGRRLAMFPVHFEDVAFLMHSLPLFISLTSFKLKKFVAQRAQGNDFFPSYRGDLGMGLPPIYRILSFGLHKRPIRTTEGCVKMTSLSLTWVKHIYRAIHSGLWSRVKAFCAGAQLPSDGIVLFNVFSAANSKTRHVRAYRTDSNGDNRLDGY